MDGLGADRVSGTGGGYTVPRTADRVTLRGSITVPDTDAGAFADTGLSVTLPEAGTWKVTAEVRGQIDGPGPGGGGLRVRLFNVTAGVQLPYSIRTIVTVTEPATGDFAATACGPASDLVVVTGPTVIRLEASKSATGTATTVRVGTGPSGWTSLAYERIA